MSAGPDTPGPSGPSGGAPPPAGTPGTPASGGAAAAPPPAGSAADRRSRADARAADPRQIDRRGHERARGLAIFAVWANRQMLNPDNWSNTSTKLLQNAVVREATANYLVDQLYTNVNVEEEISAKLPPQIKPLAGPLSGALHNLANEAAQRALANPRVQEAWKQANKAADQQLVTIVKGGKGAVVITNGEVSLDLASDRRRTSPNASACRT